MAHLAVIMHGTKVIFVLKKDKVTFPNVKVK